MTCTSPPPPSSSTWKLVMTTISVALTMLAKLGLISECRYSMSMGVTPDQASRRSAKAFFRISWMIRFSVAVNSRPSILVVPAVAAEEVVHHREHQLRVDHHQARAAQRADLDEVQARRHVQRVHVFVELLHLDGVDRDLGSPAQQVVEVDAEQAREALVDHLERRHAAAHDAHLAQEIVRARLARGRVGLGAHRAAIHAVDQRVDLVLVEDLLFGHGSVGHCITKLVK